MTLLTQNFAILARLAATTCLTLLLSAGGCPGLIAANTDAKETPMKLADFDRPEVLDTLFFPRAARPGSNNPPDIHDGTIPINWEIELGYRLFTHTPDSPVVLHFHGNGEIAADYDGIAPLFHKIGLSLLVVDYRGYGWSTGTPTVSTLLSDAEKVVAAMPEVLQSHGITSSRYFVMGRSLGSAPAIHVAYKFPEKFAGLIIESGFGRATNLFRRLGLPEEVTAKMHDPVGNDIKMQSIEMPVLIIHGEADTLLPISHSELLYKNSASPNKQFLRIPAAGHNDLILVGKKDYMTAIKKLTAD